MPVVIEEVTAETFKPVAPERTGKPLTEMPGDTANELRRTLAAVRRADAQQFAEDVILVLAQTRRAAIDRGRLASREPGRKADRHPPRPIGLGHLHDAAPRDHVRVRDDVGGAPPRPPSQFAL